MKSFEEFRIELKEYSPNIAYQAKGGKKSGKLGKSSVYSLRGKDESKKDFRKSHVKDVEGGYVGGGHKPTPGSLKKEDYYRGTGEKVQVRTKKFMDKKGQKGAPGLDAMKARTADHKAKRGVKPEPGHRGMKPIDNSKKVAAMRKEEVVTELNRYGKETGKATGSLNKRVGTPVKSGGTSSPVMRAVRTSIRKETGKPEGQQKKERGKKPPVAGEYGARRSPAQIVQNRRASKAAADASMRDTRGT